MMVQKIDLKIWTTITYSVALVRNRTIPTFDILFEAAHLQQLMRRRHHETDA
jgi:hypothetical protein